MNPIRLLLAFTFATAAALYPLSLASAAEKSGKAWVSKFQDHGKLADLEDGFEKKVRAFIKAIQDAGGKVQITSTRRPKERPYLMHWSWKIAKENYNAKQVPKMAGVTIEWWHGNQKESKKRAQEMVDAFGINKLKVPPSLTSRHTEGKAVDMLVTWSGTLKIRKKDGTTVKIPSTPRDSTNPDLIAVGKTYGVIHFKDVDKDKVHWSTDGK